MQLLALQVTPCHRRKRGKIMEKENILQEARKNISEIDSKMAALFEDRMKQSAIIAEYKKHNGVSIYDAEREREVIDNNVDLILDEEIKSYYVEYLQSILDISKQYQRKCIKGARIAYCGEEGAFAQIAADKIFPEGDAISYRSFQDAYEAVENGECDVAVLPIENSYAGEVGSVMDIMFRGSLYINDVHTFHVEQCLLGTKDADISDIKKVISHPQALAQCDKYIKKIGAKKEETGNTSFAAKMVADENDKTVAAIASREAANIYGLKILDASVAESQDNSTRFAVFSRNQARYLGGSKHNHIIMMFTVKDEAGALAKAMNVIGAYGYNMSAVRSRPTKSLSFSYYFYVEADGDGNVENEKRMLKALGVTCDKLKVVGDMKGRT